MAQTNCTDNNKSLLEFFYSNRKIYSGYQWMKIEKRALIFDEVKSIFMKKFYLLNASYIYDAWLWEIRDFLIMRIS